jgi:hypothetical protein
LERDIRRCGTFPDNRIQLSLGLRENQHETRQNN